MITYKCDKCGYELEKQGIVSNTHKTHNFEELRVSLPGNIKDVCQSCFKEILSAKRQADREKEKSKKNRILEILGMG